VVNQAGKIVRSPRSVLFHANLRHYNNSFLFTSNGIIINTRGSKHGPPVFVIQGQMHHKAGSLLAVPGVKPTFLQLFMFAIDDQERLRAEAFTGRNATLSRAIIEVIEAVNPFSRFLQTNA